MVYIKKEGVHSQVLNHETMFLNKWEIPMGTQLQVVHRPGVEVLGDYLSLYVVHPMEWRLDRQLVRRLFEVWGTPQIDLFALASNIHLPLWYYWTYHLEALALDALLQPWTGLS